MGTPGFPVVAINPNGILTGLKEQPA